MLLPCRRSVYTHPVTVSGQPVAGMVGVSIVPVRRGMQAPLILWGANRLLAVSGLCISRTGQLFAPENYSSDVLVFDSDGVALQSISGAALGIKKKTVSCAAFADKTPPTLLLASSCEPSPLVAVNPTTHAVRWATARGIFSDCTGLVALSHHGVAIAATATGLVVHRLSDGERVGSLSWPWYLK